jgi:hypothetical protein
MLNIAVKRHTALIAEILGNQELGFSPEIVRWVDLREIRPSYLSKNRISRSKKQINYPIRLDESQSGWMMHPDR